MTADLERFGALFADPDYDGPDLPAAQQPDPGDGLAWGLLGTALAGLGLSVRGEVRARRTRDGGGVS